MIWMVRSDPSDFFVRGIEQIDAFDGGRLCRRRRGTRRRGRGGGEYVLLGCWWYREDPFFELVGQCIVIDAFTGGR